jgi:hypothetical protein
MSYANQFIRGNEEISDEMPITLKAVYEVSTTPEASQYKVWTGRLESHSYNFSLRQW